MKVSQENRIRPGNMTQVLLVAISITITHGLGYAQVPVASQEVALPSSAIVHGMPRDNQLTSIHEPSGQMATSPCRLQVDETSVQPPANTTETTLTSGTLDYTPLSARCKFNLFLKQTHSPYTFVSAGFQATWNQATDGWPQYGGGTRGGRSDSARLWRIRNRADLSRRLLYRRSCIRSHATFRRASER
jgi:hypothetical protein